MKKIKSKQNLTMDSMSGKSNGANIVHHHQIINHQIFCNEIQQQLKLFDYIQLVKINPINGYNK